MRIFIQPMALIVHYRIPLFSMKSTLDIVWIYKSSNCLDYDKQFCIDYLYNKSNALHNSVNVYHIQSKPCKNLMYLVIVFEIAFWEVYYLLCRCNNLLRAHKGKIWDTERILLSICGFCRIVGKVLLYWKYYLEKKIKALLNRNTILVNLNWIKGLLQNLYLF